MGVCRSLSFSVDNMNNSLTLILTLAMTLNITASRFYGGMMMRHTRMSESHMLCGGKIDLQSYLFLNKLCEDCFSLYRDPDVYAVCRSGCFGSSFFQECMTSLLVEADTRSRVDMLLEANEINNKLK